MRDKTLVVLGTPDTLMTTYMFLQRIVEGGKVPDRSRTLAVSQRGAVTIERDGGRASAARSGSLGARPRGVRRCRTFLRSGAHHRRPHPVLDLSRGRGGLPAGSLPAGSLPDGGGERAGEREGRQQRDQQDPCFHP